jgi:transcriptional regulator with XRE-family HTH domain
MTTESFGQTVARLRKAADLSQKKLATDIGRSERYITLIEADRPAQQVTVGMVDDLAAILGTEVYVAAMRDGMVRIGATVEITTPKPVGSSPSRVSVNPAA